MTTHALGAHTSSASHTSPAAHLVVRQQMRLLRLSGRVIFLGVLLAAPLLLGIGAGVLGYHQLTAAEILVQLAPGALLAAGAWGFLIWRDEPPRRRAYHSTLPVDAALHDVARIAAGAIWLMALLMAYCLLATGVAVAAGDAAALRAAAPSLLLFYLLSPLTAYTLVAALATVSGRPLEWLIGGYAGFVLAMLASVAFDQRWLMRISEAVLGGPYGVVFTLVGGWRGAEALLAEPTGAALGRLASWLPLALVWLLVAIALAYVAAIIRARRSPVA